MPRFYRGGPAIAALRGIEPAGDRVPEEWVGSTTTVFGEQELGLSRLPDGALLRDAVAADPVGFFGPEHAARRGADPALLVKLLDAGERLPVHVHPDGAFARELLGSPYGKTEAWIVVAAAGARRQRARRLPRGRERGDARALGARAGRGARCSTRSTPSTVRAGDAIFVPAGVPHAIGEGVLIVELQEPTRPLHPARVAGLRHRGRGRGEPRPGLGGRAGLRRARRRDRPRCVGRAATATGR